MGSLLLTVSVIFSIIANIFAKLSRGFKNKGLSILSFLFFGLCIYFLTLSVQYIEVGIVYAVWSGAAIAATAIMGIVFFKETANKVKLLSILVILIGVIILQLSS
ncbi:QacE family quaternary ammonium compound efflux SMR transporter [Virgibacillus sp. NKC19-3]|nr:QacE family quaternary ammonium compound efflux SMR transporter [Virgibacillus sp. NKC19-3]